MDPTKKSPEKSRYAVPVAVAVAAHAFLFFGFAPPKKTPEVKTPASLVKTDSLPPREFELTTPEERAEESCRLPAQSPSVTPSQPELLPPLLSTRDFRFTPVQVDHGPVDPKNFLLPKGPPHLETGVGIGSEPSLGPLGIGQLDRVPRATFQARPDYPFSLRNRGVSGEVVVDFLVDEQGQVSDVRVVRSSDSELEPTTVRAVARWRFEPGKRKGRPVRFRMSQTVSFAVVS